jgi:hypothetical protein
MDTTQLQEVQNEVFVIENRHGYKIYKTSCPFEEESLPTVDPLSYLYVGVNEEFTFYVAHEEPKPFVEDKEIEFEEVSLVKDDIVQEDEYTQITVVDGDIHYCIK